MPAGTWPVATPIPTMPLPAPTLPLTTNQSWLLYRTVTALPPGMASVVLVMKTPCAAVPVLPPTEVCKSIETPAAPESDPSEYPWCAIFTVPRLTSVPDTSTQENALFADTALSADCDDPPVPTRFRVRQWPVVPSCSM